MCNKNYNHMRYSSWDTEWVLGHFLPFYPDNQNFEKMKKASRYVIILKLCNKKDDHMMYAYSDMKFGKNV